MNLHKLAGRDMNVYTKGFTFSICTCNIIMATIVCLATYLQDRSLVLNMSPGDGHCLLHSTVTSWNLTRHTDPPISINSLKNSILSEATSQQNMYKAFLDDQYQESFLCHLKEYLFNKRYNTWFGDCVPLITANALRVDVTILNERDELPSGMCRLDTLEYFNSSPSETPIIIHRRGNHFNGVVPLPCPPNCVAAVASASQCVSGNVTQDLALPTVPVATSPMVTETGGRQPDLRGLTSLGDRGDRLHRG